MGSVENDTGETFLGGKGVRTGYELERLDWTIYIGSGIELNLSFIWGSELDFLALVTEH